MNRLISFKPSYVPVLGVVVAALLFPANAEAHLNSTGLGPSYDGLLHLLSSPEDIFPALALSLFAGQLGRAYSRRALMVLPMAWLVGGLIGLGRTSGGSAALDCISFLVLGGLLAANMKISMRLFTALAGLLGLSHGYLNGAGIGTTESGALAMVGLAFGVFVLVALAASFVVQLRRQWTLIAVRIVGSWIVATGILLTGWALRRH
jgi:hydrogenase/urease accessory protein HupE